MSIAVTSTTSGLAGAIEENAGGTVFTGVIMLIVGLLALISPLVAGLSFALIIGMLIAVTLIATGLFEIIIALQLRPADGWSWFLFSAIMSVLLGVMLWRQFPLSGIWAVGILIGFRLLFTGWALVFIGRRAEEKGNAT